MLFERFLCCDSIYRKNMTHYRPFEDEGESDELCAEKIRDLIREEVLIVTPSKRVYKQRKKLKDGNIKQYQTRDLYIRIPSSSKIRSEKPVAVITWEGIERLMTAKEAYNISDRALSSIFAELMAFY